MSENQIFFYQPTLNGFRYTSHSAEDPLRQIPAILYPDNRRERIFDAETLKKLDRYPFRPVVCAMSAPRYRLDLHSVAGTAGEGRFAVVRGNVVCWLDEFACVETEYYNGEMRYTAQDDRFGPAPIRAAFIAGRGATGMVMRIDARDLPEGTEIYFLHGGMLGWNTHSPFYLPYRPDLCWSNAVSLHGEYARIEMDERDCDVCFEGLKPVPYQPNWISVNCMWKRLEGFKQYLLVRAEGAVMQIAPPEGLMAFDPTSLCSAPSAQGGIACAKLATDRVQYAAVGLCEDIRTAPLEELFGILQAENRKIPDRLVVRTGNTLFDGAVTAAAFPTDGVFGDNVFLHGNLSWREGYLGWRVAYGPLAYGMFDQTAKHFDSHFTTTRITEGPDRGVFCGTIEEADPGSIAFYNMHQTALHQARRYWEYTGDRAFAERLLPITEECIQREGRRVKPGEEMLFENCLNTWISDHHWVNMGQCTQSSAYLYNLHLLAAELAEALGGPENTEKKAYYTEQAEAIKRDMNRVLWQKRKGVFAYAKDLRGNQMLHTEPELADIYHPTELGVTDPLQTYQMLDWAEDNLRYEITDNGGRLVRSSNWYPNGGDKYSHSVYELNGGEEMNLALAYQQIGLAEPAYEIFQFIYHSLYGGRDPGIEDYNFKIYCAREGLPPLQSTVALNLPCHLTTTGTGRANPLFGDTIGMFGREVYEGILGIRPMLQRKEVWLTPCLPSEMPHAEVKSASLDYIYDRTDRRICLQYRMKHDGCALCVKLYLPVAEVERVTLNGEPVPFETEGGFGNLCVSVTVPDAGEGVIDLSYAPAKILPIEDRRVQAMGSALTLSYPNESITELMDPQGLLSHVCMTPYSLTATVTDQAGSGVFFLKMRTGSAEYIRPVKLRIPSGKKTEVFKSFREEFEAPYNWKPVNMDDRFNYAAPLDMVNAVVEGAPKPPASYTPVNYQYYTIHINGGFILGDPWHKLTLDRWRSLVGDDGLAMTGEGIPFRSCREGNCLAAAALENTVLPDRVVVPVHDAGRAAYLLITGITFPMQSHVENLRVIFRYEDGVKEEFPLYNPDGIGDMWFNKLDRYHYTAANGFENLSDGQVGAVSSAGLDLTKPIYTDLEGHILRFKLRPDVRVEEIEMRIVANDVGFALMGVTLLK